MSCKMSMSLRAPLGAKQSPVKRILPIKKMKPFKRRLLRAGKDRPRNDM
jgi:hypothetical protein